MTVWKLITRGLKFHWRSHLGALLGATVSAAILAGALAVGDSVRYSLREMALSRLGNIHLALNGRTQFFRDELAPSVSNELKAPVVPVIILPGTAIGQAQNSAEETRAGRVQVVGITDEFWSLARKSVKSFHPSSFILHPSDGAILNDRLAATLRVKPGDDILLRVDKPSLLSRDAPLSKIEDAQVTLRLPVAAIVGDDSFGRFSLEANQIPPLNAFVPLDALQKQVSEAGKVNTLLVATEQNGRSPLPEAAARLLWKDWKLADAGVEVRELEKQGVLDLKTDRVFLDPVIGDAALKAYPGRQAVLTYFVNELSVGDKTTPYSSVSALESPLIPRDMRDDEALINQWLADDLHAKPGDRIKLTYWLVGPMRKLILNASTFTIRGVLPMSGPALDPDLMPPIPGLTDKKNCRDWEPGVPVDLDKIRDKDQAYWANYRGTPKAFITLRAGQKLWSNRFGNLTAVRYPMKAQSPGTIEYCIKQALTPSSMGIHFAPVREQALAAGIQSMDFGQLFLGFSFFLIVAALILTALMFAFSVEQRSEEVGTLLAVGFTPKRIKRMLLLEGALLAAIAGAIGSAIAVFYTRAVIRGLTTVWKGAVGGSALQYYAEPSTLGLGAVAGFLVALISIWLVVRKQAKTPARELLSAGVVEELKPTIGGWARSARLAGLPTAIASIGIALVLTAVAFTADREKGPEYFFGAGSLLLIGGIALSRVLMSAIERGSAARKLSVASLGIRSSARRRSRSLSAIGLLACGSFLVIAVGANRQDAYEGAGKRESGTGGYALFGDSSLPIYQDLNSPEGREAFNIDAATMQGVDILPLRLREGDEASCLNLNRAQVPRVLGVVPDRLQERKAFTFAQVDYKVAGLRNESSRWSLLDADLPDASIPAIGDQNTVVWSLGKGIGDTVPYVDERGMTYKLRIVGIISNSILQGGLLISERQFIKLFPSQSGYQVFLIDAPKNVSGVQQALMRALQDTGFNATPASERLAAFNAVENTYLSIFAVLGGLGLLLGSFGLGVIVLRNVLERRGELAILRAVGFRVRALQWLVFSEHSLLLALGLGIGVVAALVAVLPVLRSPGVQAPYASLGLTLAAVLLSGVFWVWGATSLALRGPLLDALRNE